METLRKVIRFYVEGFREMTVGRTLWAIILIKLFILFVVLRLLFFPDVSAAAAREGVALCLQTVLPSLFPFFVLSSLLVQSDVPRLLSRAMAGVMYPLFGVSGAGASALILGLLGGYPVGARTVAELYGRGEIAREEAEQLLAFCNNSGPGFFLGVCGTAVFGSARAGMYLYLIHVGAALVTGVLLRRDLGLPRRKAVSRQRAPFDLAAALPAAVQSSFAAVGSVSAFVIFFMVLLRLLSLVPALAAAARGAVRLYGDDERRERPARHARGLCALRRYHELGRAERAGADVRDACGERPVRAAVCDRKGGAGARRRPARAARGRAAFLKGLAPRRRRGYTEGAAFAAPFTL